MTYDEDGRLTVTAEMARIAIAEAEASMYRAEYECMVEAWKQKQCPICRWRQRRQWKREARAFARGES